MDIKEKKFKDIGRYALCFAMLFALSWLFPYTGDDWAWGSQIGLDRLHTWFDNYSGRYVGNLIVLALTRSNLLKSLAMTVAITGIIFLLERLIKERWSFYVSIFLLICLPKAVLRQAVVWTAGFSNYVTSIFFTLIYIVYIYWIFDEEPNQNKLRQRILPCIPLVALGMINTLIVENVTLYNVVLGIAVIIYVLFRYHKVLIQHVCYFAGTICGTAYMFSNSVYHSISSNADGYRSVAKGGIISQALKNYFDVIYKEYFMNNIVLNLFILCTCYVIYVNYKKQSVESKNKLDKVLAACLGIMTCYNAWSLFSYIGLGTVTKQALLIVIEGSATVVAGISLIIFALVLCVVTYGIEYYCMYHRYGMPYMHAPSLSLQVISDKLGKGIYSLPAVKKLVISMSVGGFIAFKTVIYILCVCIAANAGLLMSYLTKGKINRAFNIADIKYTSIPKCFLCRLMMIVVFGYIRIKLL